MTPIDIWFDSVWIRLKFFNYKNICDGDVIDAINQAVTQGHITQQDLHTRLLVFDTLAEGHSRREFEAVIKSLQSMTWFDVDRTRWAHNVTDTMPQHLRTVSWPWFMVNQDGFLDYTNSLAIDWSNLTLEKDFVCLMRRPTRWRSLIAKKILDNFPESQRTLSYGSMLTSTQHDRILQCDIPILLDGYTQEYHSGLIHRASDIRIMSCLMNLIVETSEQEEFDRVYWSSQFITEKTFKCFAWRQIPIWCAVPGLVDQVRALGFDVFDDWFHDHDYDSIQDGITRLSRVFQYLTEAVSHVASHGRQNLRQQVQHRLDANYQLLQSLSQRHMGHWKYIIDDIK